MLRHLRLIFLQVSFQNGSEISQSWDQIKIEQTRVRVFPLWLSPTLPFIQVYLAYFIPKASSRPLGMGLPRAAWVKLNRLRSGVGRFCSSMYKWGLAPLANCECGASEQTADHIISQCPIHRAPRGMFGLMVLDDETRCWLKSLTVSI